VLGNCFKPIRNQITNISLRPKNLPRAAGIAFVLALLAQVLWDGGILEEMLSLVPGLKAYQAKPMNGES